MDVGIDELVTVFESLARDAMKDHEKRFQERIRSVQDACNALNNAASRFEVAVRNAWGTMDRSASEYGTRMAQTIEESTRKLSRQQASASYENAERFHKDSIEVLNTIIKTVRRYVPKLRRGLRVEMAALNVALGKLETAVRSLGLALDQSPGNRIELIRRDVLHLKEAREELTKLKTDELADMKSLEANADKERDALADAEEFSSNDMLLELTRYEQSLSAKEEEIARFLQPIMKPLTKLERNESSGENRTVDLGTLRSLLDKPVETLATSQSFALIQLLDRLDEALRLGRLEIEERRRRKAEETIQQAKEGGIEKLREDYLTIQANVQETLRQLKATGLLDKKNEIERRQALIRDEKEHLISHNAELRRRTDAISRTIIKQKQSIEQQIEQVTSKNLKIRTE
jgi:hypothetical protein